MSNRENTSGNKSILLTGSQGFIGRYLKQKIGISNLILPVRNKKNDYEISYNECFNYRPNFIIHCAANPNTKYNNETYNVFNENIDLTYTLLEKFDNLHFLHLSTILIYDNYATKSIGPKTIYGTGKYTSELLCNNFQRIKNIKVTNLRIPATVGPGLTHGFIYDLIQKIKNTTNGEILLFGKQPGSYKPFIHVDDVYKKIVKVFDNKMYGSFDIGPDDNLSVEEIAKIAMKHLNKEVKIQECFQVF